MRKQRHGSLKGGRTPGITSHKYHHTELPRDSRRECHSRPDDDTVFHLVKREFNKDRPL